MLIRLVPFAALFLRASALEVAPDSPCARKCIDDTENGNPSWSNASLTFGPDLVCEDADYVGATATNVGKKFVECQNCMQSSGWEDSDSGERDTTWFLFQNRGAVDWCLFGRFAEESNKDISSTKPYKKCFSACNPIYAASDYRVKSDPSKYDYCDSDGNYTADAQNCIKCLYDSDGLTILGNIVTTLTHFCETKPGKNISFDEHIYNTTRISLASSSNSSDTSPSNSSDPSSPSSKPDSPDSKNDSKSGLSAGALGGIIVGALIVVAVVLAGILLFLRRLQKRKSGVSAPYEGVHEAPPYSEPGYNYESQQKYGYHELQQPRSMVELGAAHTSSPVELSGASEARRAVGRYERLERSGNSHKCMQQIARC